MWSGEAILSDFSRGESIDGLAFEKSKVRKKSEAMNRALIGGFM